MDWEFCVKGNYYFNSTDTVMFNYQCKISADQIP